MKEVLSLITFGIGALLLRGVRCRLQAECRHCSRLEPSKPGYCNTKASPTLACRSLIFAAAMLPEVKQR